MVASLLLSNYCHLWVESSISNVLGEDTVSEEKRKLVNARSSKQSKFPSKENSRFSSNLKLSFKIRRD